jgi:hypothetical protein
MELARSNINHSITGNAILKNWNQRNISSSIPTTGVCTAPCVVKVVV